MSTSFIHTSEASSRASKPRAFLALHPQRGHCLWLKPRGITDHTGYILRQSMGGTQYEAQLHTHLPDGVLLKVDFECAASDVVDYDLDVKVSKVLEGMKDKGLREGTKLVELLTDVAAWLQCLDDKGKQVLIAGMVKELLDDHVVTDGLSERRIGKMKVMAINRGNENDSNQNVKATEEHTQAKGG